MLKAINFPPINVSSLLYKFWYTMVLFLFGSKYCFVSPVMSLPWPMNYLKVYYLISKYLGIFHKLLWFWFLFELYDGQTVFCTISVFFNLKFFCPKSVGLIVFYKSSICLLFFCLLAVSVNKSVDLQLTVLNISISLFSFFSFLYYEAVTTCILT